MLGNWGVAVHAARPRRGSDNLNYVNERGTGTERPWEWSKRRLSNAFSRFVGVGLVYDVLTLL